MPEFSEELFRNRLVLRFKESALKAYLCRACKSYSAFSVKSLMSIFELPETKLTQIISKLILRNKLQAHLDVAEGVLVLDKDSSEV